LNLPAIQSIEIDAGRRTRAKERLYVLCQVLGWSFLLGIQVVFSRVFGQPGQDRKDSTAVVTVAIGLLLTHYARRYLTRWGWKDLGWRALLPRILRMAALLALLWIGMLYAVNYGLFGNALPAKYPIYALFAASWLNAVGLMGCWLGIYFFYHLSDRFTRLEIERLGLSATLKEAELRALKSQINPHFIFNSLNSLRALIDEDPARARQAVTQLANLLRYSLQCGQLETVPFEEELSVVNDYLALEQVRHEERLRLRLDVAPDTLQLPVPPMLLQTLVENAVKYGISRRPEGGEIAIFARCEHGVLRIQVTNPGELTAPAAGASPSTGVGLRNAAERLRLLFGERATLQLRAAPPGLVVAEAAIPSLLRP
jgi:signal transduction histidine kinase